MLSINYHYSLVEILVVVMCVLIVTIVMVAIMRKVYRLVKTETYGLSRFNSMTLYILFATLILVVCGICAISGADYLTYQGPLTTTAVSMMKMKQSPKDMNTYVPWVVTKQSTVGHKNIKDILEMFNDGSPFSNYVQHHLKPFSSVTPQGTTGIKFSELLLDSLINAPGSVRLEDKHTSKHIPQRGGTHLFMNVITGAAYVTGSLNYKESLRLFYQRLKKKGTSVHKVVAEQGITSYIWVPIKPVTNYLDDFRKKHPDVQLDELQVWALSVMTLYVERMYTLALITAMAPEMNADKPLSFTPPSTGSGTNSKPVDSVYKDTGVTITFNSKEELKRFHGMGNAEYKKYENFEDTYYTTEDGKEVQIIDKSKPMRPKRTSNAEVHGPIIYHDKIDRSIITGSHIHCYDTNFDKLDVQFKQQADANTYFDIRSGQMSLMRDRVPIYRKYKGVTMGIYFISNLKHYRLWSPSTTSRLVLVFSASVLSVILLCETFNITQTIESQPSICNAVPLLPIFLLSLVLRDLRRDHAIAVEAADPEKYLTWIDNLVQDV